MSNFMFIIILLVVIVVVLLLINKPLRKQLLVKLDRKSVV